MMRAVEKPVFVSKEERRREEETAARRCRSERKRSDRDWEREKEDQARKRTRLEREREIELLKQQYLGSAKPKKRVIKASEKLRFSFDWDITDDTSGDSNSLYEPLLLHGRGFRAGTDRSEQKKLAANKHREIRRMKERTEGTRKKDLDDMRMDHHWSQKKLDEMTERDWRIFREDYNISCKGSRVPWPIRSWAESKLSPELLKAVERAGYKTPSPIQMAAVPIGLQQRDLIGIAETGSGKTASFVLPMLSYIARLPPINEADGPYAVVMVPTRELAQQIHDETVTFAYYLGVRVVSVVGGLSVDEQASRISRGCEVVIATPGRLLDLLERRYLVLNQCRYVVLDEADRMVDMGFEPQVVGVLDGMRSEDENLELVERITHMFSATMPPVIERLAKKYLRNPIVVNIGISGKITDRITQRIIMMNENDKLDILKRQLNELGDNTAIVFFNTKKAVDNAVNVLASKGYRVTALHSEKSQDQRHKSLEGFKSKRYNVLVATDLAARGIDIPDLAHVMNYDMPASIQTYTHRIGRTGRAGRTGVATTFLTLRDTKIFHDLKQMLIQSNSDVPPELARHKAATFKACHFPIRTHR